jgi:hypothetical protein
MGALEDLLRQLQEAAEERQKTTLPGQAPTVPRRPVATAAPAAKTAPAAKPNFAAKARPVVEPHEEMAPTPVAQVAGVAAVAGVHATPLSPRVRHEHPLLARLRQPGGAREALVLSELLRSRWRR